MRILGAALVGACAALGQDEAKSFKGKTPPQLVVPENGWFNSKALTLSGLKNRVVWLEFSFLD